MSRSVSTPSNAIGIVFLDQTEIEDPWQWQEFIDDLREVVRERYPSFTDIDTWIGNEDRVVLENGHALITVSEYCGLVAICLVPRSDWWIGELALSWCEHVSGYWEMHIRSCYRTTLRKIGTAGNGEAFFERVAG